MAESAKFSETSTSGTIRAPHVREWIREWIRFDSAPGRPLTPFSPLSRPFSPRTFVIRARSFPFSFLCRSLVQRILVSVPPLLSRQRKPI